MEKTVLVETSARHVHVTQEALEILFGEGYELTKKKDLSQPGQFACEERVQVIGEKSSFPAVSILGQVRPACKFEISASDARSIGEDKQIVSVEIKSDERSLIFGDTVVRVSPKFSLAMHIDTDEANAVLAPAGVMGIILD